MITIQSGMLVALGFLAASLLMLVIAPAFWARAVRLTTRRIKDSMPVTDVEIRADKDRIRAEYAIEVHKLESQMEQVRLSAARQRIDLNRRDATINELQSELEVLKAAHEEAQNARRVLEQTITDRLPRVEHRLTEARKLLVTRDREIGDLTRDAEKQSRALTEATAINAQQQGEIERLESSLTTRGARIRGASGDPRFDGEVALRAELEALRAKTRDQAQLLTRMQSQAARTGGSGASVRSSDADASATATPAAAQDVTPALANPELEREIRGLKARTEDQAGEIVRLKTALAVFENESEADGKSALKDSKIALRARLQSLEAQSAQQAEVVQKLRTELAAANERLARQAAHFTSELKRLGAGTLPASGQPRRAADAARLNLTQRVAQSRGKGATAATTSATEAVQAEVTAAPDGAVPVETSAPAADVGDASDRATGNTPSPANDTQDDSKLSRATPSASRPRLLDRIAGIGRPS